MSDKIRIVMLSGWTKSGKDTVGNHLTSLYGYGRLAFADGIRDAAYEIFGVPHELMNTQEGKSSEYIDGRTVRDILIALGMFCRSIDKDVWVRKLLRRIYPFGKKHYVITDWRLPGEYTAIVENCGEDTVIKTVRINRFTQPPLVDYTEQALDDFQFDEVIDNDGTVVDLIFKMDALLKKWDSE